MTSMHPCTYMVSKESFADQRRNGVLASLDLTESRMRASMDRTIERYSVASQIARQL